MGAAQAQAEPHQIALDDVAFQPPQDFGAVNFEPTHFDEGACRLAFRGTIDAKGFRSANREAPWGCWRKIGRSYPCVVKKFKSQYAEAASSWKQDMGLLVKSGELASLFNDRVAARKKLKFARPVLYRVVDIGGEKWNAGGGVFGGVIGGGICGGGGALVAAEIAAMEAGAIAVGAVASGGIGLVLAGLAIGAACAQHGECAVDERVCVEPYLSGKFRKVNSNTGWFRRSSDADIGQAFSHWTWCHTGGELLVCDLQGTRTEGGWLLTDPAAHSSGDGGRFGGTDLGSDGIAQFFATHVCNDMCKHFPRPPPGAAPFPVRRSSTWSFQLGSM